MGHTPFTPALPGPVGRSGVGASSQSVATGVRGLVALDWQLTSARRSVVLSCRAFTRPAPGRARALWASGAKPLAGLR